MRLLNTETLEVKEFLTDSDIPIFAILSHTWEKDEVTFQDIQNLENAKKKAGWSKIENACSYVRQYKNDWIWIDTCCIDKSSSAELSETLNSMYQYYGDGRVCIAYLSDVSWERNIEELKQSRWFKRGWTLQELVAPHYMVFLDKNWNKIGTRHSMRKVISVVTSIPVQVFEKNGQIDGYSIAQKMSWAASRKTTRPEDMAYCLMGLFGVNMPPIYGEGGAKAFMRLQQEIIKYSEDRSIFAWVASNDSPKERGLFASSPLEFASSGDIDASKSMDLGDKSSFSFGNNGLRIYLPLQPQPYLGEDIFLVSLHCRAGNKYIGIYLQKKEHRYVRLCRYFPLPHIDHPSGELQEVVVKESVISRQRDKSDEYEIPIEFKLGHSQITLLGEVDKYNKNPRSVQSLSLRRNSDRYFRAQTKKGNKFTVNLWRPFDSVLRVLFFVNNRYIPDLNNFYDIPLLQDSVLSCVHDSNALVSCFIHMTGDSSMTHILELNLIPSSSAQFKLYHQIDEFKSSPHASSSTSMNFMLDTTSTPSYFKYDHSAVPSNLLCSQEGGRVYGTLSDLDNQHDIHCVFAYYRELSKIYVFVALGLCSESEGDIPWIDVTVPYDKIPICDIWESYLPSGSRYGHRNKQNVIAPLLDYSYNFTVEKKTLGGLVWYHVVVTEVESEDEWEEDESEENEPEEDLIELDR